MKKMLGLFALAGTLVARGADPYVGYIYPAGIQAGTTNRLIVGGQFFGNIKGALAGEGVKVLDVELVPNFPPPVGEQRRWMVKWLDQIALKGDFTQPRLPVESEHFSDWRSNRWYFVLGDLDLGKRTLVEHFLYTPRNALQMSPALSQKLLVTVAADADAKPGVREFRVFSPQGFSPPRPFVVTTVPHVEEPLYVPPHRPQPAAPVVTNIPCVLDGQIMPGSTDRWILPLEKGRTVTLRVTAREFQPYIGDAVPGFFNSIVRVVNRRGEEIALADVYLCLPDPGLTFAAPADDEYTLEIHDNLFRGREDFTYEIDVRDGTWAPSVRELSLSPLPKWDVPKDSLVRTYAGVVEKPGKAHKHAFTVKEPCELGFDLLARRAGSPLDARVTVWKGGVEVARVDDVTNTVHLGSVIQAECDPVGRVKIEEPGKYEIRVEDEAGRGGPDYFYTLRLHRPAPRCEVWCHKSGFAPRSWWGGQRVRFTVMRKDGFDGSVTLEENDFIKFTPNVIPASSNRMDVTVVCKLKQPCPPTNVAVTASAVVGGVNVDVPVIPANEYNQAFAWDHLIPAREFAFKAFPGQQPKNFRRQRQQQQRPNQQKGQRPNQQKKQMRKM